MVKKSANRRTVTIVTIIICMILIFGVTLAGIFMDPECFGTNFEAKNLKPSWNHLFGTDWMGRDMFFRTIKGLSTSIYIGIIAAAASSVLALFLGVIAGIFGKQMSCIFNWLVDLFMGIPHLILLILISIMVGKGVKGVTIGVIVTHWCSLGRIVQAEIMGLRDSQFVLASEKLGKSKVWIAYKHILPHVLPQFIVGLVLMFPHAIMHEASITFLGFGLPAEQPAIGIILSEAMKYLTTGMWWLAAFPGACLLLIVVLFEVMGNNLRLLMDPYKAQE